MPRAFLAGTCLKRGLDRRDVTVGEHVLGHGLSVGKAALMSTKSLVVEGLLGLGVLVGPPTPDVDNTCKDLLRSQVSELREIRDGLELAPDGLL